MKESSVPVCKRNSLLLLSVIALAAVTFNLTAQTNGTLYSWKGKEGQSNLDTAHIVSLFREATSIYNTDRERGKLLLQQVLAASKASKFYKGVFTCLQRLGYYSQFEGDHANSLHLYLEALHYLKYPENAKHANGLYNNIALAYSNLGKYGLAFDWYDSALVALSKTNIDNGIDSVAIYVNIGVLWMRMEEPDKALHTFSSALPLAERKKDTAQTVTLYENIGETYFRLKNWTQAEYYQSRALDLALSQSAYDVACSALCGLALINSGKGRYNKALKYATKAISLADTKKVPAYLVIEAKAALGIVYFDMKQLDKAKPILLKTLQEAKKINAQDLIQLLEPKVTELWAMTGSYREAYEQLKHYTAVNDSLYKKERAQSLESWMNTRIAEKDRAVLAQQLRISRQQNQLQQKNIWIAIAILTALLIVSVLLLVVRNYKHRQQAIILQLRQTQEINQLKAQVRGEERERQRIARELHDGIASQLWAIKLNVDSMMQTPAEPDKGGLALVFQQLSNATQDIRKTAHNLMPDLLLEEGLAPALASVCDKVGKQTLMEVDFQEYGMVPRFDPEIELSIYRMVQELIQNVLKHARGATQLLVQLSCTDALLNITVDDNGSGFDGTATGAGMGIAQITKRVQALNGLFDVRSLPGNGSTAYLEFEIQYLL